MENEVILVQMTKLVDALTEAQDLAQVRLSHGENRADELEKAISERTKNLLQSCIDQANALTQACKGAIARFNLVDEGMSDLANYQANAEKSIERIDRIIEGHTAALFALSTCQDRLEARLNEGTIAAIDSATAL